MFHYIEELQQKPEYVRRNITIILTLVIFMVVVFVWLSTSDINIGNINKEQEEDINIGEVLSPFANIKNTVGDAVDDIGNNIDNMKKQLNVDK